MIEKWFEPFTRLLKVTEKDGLGGEQAYLMKDCSFSGVLSFTPGHEITLAGQPMLQENPVLLHTLSQTLNPGDYVRRERDGAVYRVTDRSDSLHAPAFSGLRFAQTPLERTVIPC